MIKFVIEGHYLEPLEDDDLLIPKGLMENDVHDSAAYLVAFGYINKIKLETKDGVKFEKENDKEVPF